MKQLALFSSKEKSKKKYKNSAEGYVATAKSSYPHDYSTYLHCFLILAHVQVSSQKVSLWEMKLNKVDRCKFGFVQ